MDKKEIQTQRIKGYFVQATKEILRGEGLKSISVRNIADQAGYSYATLYNYFKDIKELIFFCVKDFQAECNDFIIKETAEYNRGIDKLKGIIKAYMKYFIQYPGIFELFFLEEISDISNHSSQGQLIYSFLDRLSSDEWNYCINIKIIKKEIVETKKQQINYLVTGLLLYYLNKRYPDSYNKFLKITDIQLDDILGN